MLSLIQILLLLLYQLSEQLLAEPLKKVGVDFAGPLISSANKVQLIDLISRYIIEKLRCVTFHGRFIVTFSDPTPIQVEGGIATPRTDLRTTHEEADVNIIRQCLSCIEDGAKCVKVLCDDTDVCILLTVYAFRYQVQSQILMESFSSNRTLVNINETCKKHAAIVPSLIGAHAISGCDQCAQIIWYWKMNCSKIFAAKYTIDVIGKYFIHQRRNVQWKFNFYCCLLWCEEPMRFIESEIRGLTKKSRGKTNNNIETFSSTPNNGSVSSKRFTCPLSSMYLGSLYDT